MAYDLKAIKSTKRKLPPRMIIYGDNGLGKTPICASAPDSIGILTEADGMSAYDGQAFPECSTFEQVLDCVGCLIEEDHDFKTVFLDSADWTDALIQKEVCALNGWANIDSKDFNKDGYRQCVARWKELLEGLDILRSEKGMMVLLTCKVTSKQVTEVLTAPYTRFLPALSEGGPNMKDSNPLKLLCDWCDIIGLLRHNIEVNEVKSAGGKKDSKAVVQKGESTLKLHIEAHPSYVGKNRYGLSDIAFHNPFDWDSFLAAIDSNS